MLRLNQRGRATLFIWIGLLATCAGAREVAASSPAGAANAVPAAVPAAGPAVHDRVPIHPVPNRACVTGNPYPNFDPIANPTNPNAYLNVASFFDRNRRSKPEHYFIKYFEPPTSGRYTLEGFSLLVYAAMGSSALSAAGVIKTRVESPVFPGPDQLGSLQVLHVDGRGTGTDTTCVDLAPYDVELGPGEAAWLVVQFPDAAHFIGVLVDINQAGNTDRSGDYLTRNSGRLWYRPDPTQTPTYDWAFTPYATLRTRKVDATWAAYKQLYR